MIMDCGHTMCLSCTEQITSRAGNCPVCRHEITGVARNYALLDFCQDKEDWAQSLRVATCCTEEIPEALKPFSRLLVLHLRGKSVADEVSRLMLDYDMDEILSWVSVLKLSESEEMKLLTHISKESRNIDFLKKYDAGWLVQYLPS